METKEISRERIFRNSNADEIKSVKTCIIKLSEKIGDNFEVFFIRVCNFGNRNDSPLAFEFRIYLQCVNNNVLFLKLYIENSSINCNCKS